MRIIELFAGIGACSKALERLGYNVEILDAVEIDKYAIKSFNAIHGTDFEVQDITNWDKYYENVDIITHGSPCQDFSVAGKQAGGDRGSGTRSSLMYETIRIVGKIRPKYVLWENVKNLLSKKHRHNFDAYIETMKNLGYNSYYEVLNAKDYGIPQNRERVFTVSIREDIDKGYEFPEKEELKIRLKDMLEEEVEEKYYLSDKGIKYFKEQSEDRGENLEEYKEKRMLKVAHGCDKGANISLDVAPTLDTQFSNNWRGVLLEPKCVQVGELDMKGHEQMKRFYSPEGLSPTLTTMGGGQREPKIITEGNYMPSGHDAGRIVNENGLAPTVKENHGTVTAVLQEPKVIIGSTQKHAAISTDGIVPTLTSAMGQGGGHVPMHNYQIKIRKLTPRECWRLMGFDDEDFEKARNVPMSNTQLYKQARKLNLRTSFRKDF